MLRQRWIAQVVLYCGRTLLHSPSAVYSLRALSYHHNLLSQSHITKRHRLFSTTTQSTTPRMDTKTPIVVIIGAGSKHDKGVEASGLDDLPPSVRWGLGGALPLVFAEHGCHIVLMGRRTEVLEQVARNVRTIMDNNSLDDSSKKVVCIPCDVTDSGMVKTAFATIHNDHFDTTKSYIDCVVFNIAAPFPPGFSFGEDCLQPHQLDPDEMTKQHDIQVNGLVRVCQQVVPGMLERSRGCILLSGATMQLRGGAKFAAIAPAKTALRSLGQSMFQTYGPRGIHVCNLVIDGVIDSPNTRAWMPPEKLMNPYDIASQYYSAYQQPSTVWSFEITISPGFSAQSVGMRM